MEDAFDYFEKYKQLPVVMIGDKGQYIINEVPPRRPKNLPPEEKKKYVARAHINREVGTLADAVHQWPQFPGGANVFMKYLEDLGKNMASFFQQELKKLMCRLNLSLTKMACRLISKF